MFDYKEFLDLNNRLTITFLSSNYRWKSVQLSSDDGSLVAISWDVPENDERYLVLPYKLFLYH